VWEEIAQHLGTYSKLVRKATLGSFTYQGFVEVILLGFSPKYSFQFGRKIMQSKSAFENPQFGLFFC